MEISVFRNKLSSYINNHGEPLGSMWTHPTLTLDASLVEQRLYTDLDNLAIGQFVKCPDGREKLVLDIVSFQSIAVATLVSLPETN